jgi:hypothetical protein
MIDPTMSTPAAVRDQSEPEQQRQPGQTQDSDHQQYHNNACRTEPRHPDAHRVMRSGGYPDPRSAGRIRTGWDDLRLGKSRR